MSPPHLQRMRLYRPGCSSPCGQLEWETHTVSPKRDRDQRTQDFAGQSLGCSTITCCVATRHGVFEPMVRHGATIFRDTARQSSLASHGNSLKVVRQSATRRIHELPLVSRHQDVDYLCEFRMITRMFRAIFIQHLHKHRCVVALSKDSRGKLAEIFLISVTMSGEGVRFFCIPSGRLAS